MSARADRWVLRGVVSAVAGLLAASAPAHADSFEARADGAVRVKRLDDVVWALTATCDAGDDVVQRQCRLLRDRRAAHLGAATLLVKGNGEALELGAWSPQRKSLPMTVTSCIRCAGIEVAGTTWRLVGTGSVPRVDGARLRTTALHTTTRTFPDEASATAWTTAVKAARVQYLLKVPRPAARSAARARPDGRRWTAGDQQGLAFEVVGFRVVTPCDGLVIAAAPPAQPATPDPTSCPAAMPAAGTDPAGSPHVAALTGSMIKAAMQPVLDAANACHARYGIAGRAKLVMTISGDGAVGAYEQQGDFANTPTGACIDAAVKRLRFPPSQKPTTKLGYPIVLR
ncbi:MAG: hypothetical protein M3680_22780 [Myxococcota bacterium]|nr:hypothetical protein [Myxococcota bacterium]